MLNDVTRRQRNAAAAEELSTTAEEMNSQAEVLQQAVALFRTADDENQPAAWQPRAPVRTAPAPMAYGKPAPVHRTMLEPHGISLSPAKPLGDEAEFKRF